MMTVMRMLLVAGLLLVGLCACQKHDAAHPLYIRAQKMLLDNDFQEAAKCFSQYLELYPQSAAAHKELATIYDDRLKAPVLAIYHYRKFLEYAPANHPDRATVTQWIEQIEQKYYLHLKNRYNDPEDLKSTKVRYEMASDELTKLKTDFSLCRTKLGDCQDRIRQDSYFIAKLKQQNALMIKETAAARQGLDDQTQRNEALAKELTDIKNINAVLHQDVARFRNANSRLKEAAVAALREVDRVRAAVPPGPWLDVNSPLPRQEAQLTWLRKYEADPLSADALAGSLERMPLPQSSVLTPERPAAAVVPAPEPVSAARIYTVRSGDTLSGISKKFYGSSRFVSKIINANKKILSDPSALRSGQVLELPAANNP